MSSTNKTVSSCAAFSCALALILCASHAQAATISLVGAEEGTSTNGFSVQNWSNPSVSKLYNLGSSEVYGTSGYYQIRPTPNSSPSNVPSESAGANNNLGTCYDRGTGVVQSDVQACVHFLIAISLGSGDQAQNNLQLIRKRLSEAQYAAARQAAFQFAMLRAGGVATP